MFRALTCPSSGGQIVFSQHLVSSLSVNGCTVHRLRADCRSITDGKISSFSFLTFISEFRAQQTMIQERMCAYSVRWYTLMNIVVTEIYGDWKQTDWQEKMLPWLAVLLISSLYIVLTKVMSERVVMCLTTQSQPRMDPSRREVSLTFQSWSLLRLQVSEGR